MEWHFGEKSDDFVVPDCLNMYEDIHFEDIADDWSQRSICGQTSLTNCSATSDSKPSVSSQFDLDLENDMEEMDDIFSNSFLENDQMFPDSIYRPLQFEDLLSGVDADSHYWLDSSNWGISATVNPCSFPSLLGQELEDCITTENSSPYSIPEDSKRPEGSPADIVLCAMDDIDAVSDVDEPKCFEETVLVELEDVMLQLTEKTRICFRDALYRFAKTSEQEHITCHNRQEHIARHSKHVSSSDNSPTLQTIDESSRNARSNCLESNTEIDRMVANLMYNKAYCDPPEL